MKIVLQQIKIAARMMILFLILLGILYPFLVTAIAQLLFPWQANGSLIEERGKTVGSLLIGQSFTNANYFWSRPSATGPFPYNAANSAGSNLGPSNPIYLATVKERIDHLKQSDLNNNKLIPVDLVTASASGLDPEISVRSAFYQISRVANARKLSPDDLILLVLSLKKPRALGFLGETRINVLQLNLALDNLRKNDDAGTSKP